MLKRWLTLLLLALLPLLANAQSGTIYPIELSVMMTPPYGTCLKECVGSDRITIQALLKDFSKNSSQFVIQLKVTDNKNKVVLMTHFGDYVFQPGQTFTFPMGPNSPQGEKSNVLHDIFANAKVKLQNECFDEGAYTFTFQAFEKSSYPSRKIALSAAFSLPVFLQGNTVAPLPIYPYEDEVLCFESCPYQVRNIKKNATVTNVITYQWQAATISSMRVAYHLQVVDLGDITGKKEAEIKNGAGNAFSSNTPLIVNNRVYTSFFNHQRTENNYRKNHAYAWRVMAVTGDDLEKNLNFNDKSAPVRVFYYCCYPEAEKDTYKPMIDDREFDDELDRMKMDTIETEGLSALAFWKKNDVNMEKYCGIRLEIRPYGQSKWSETFVAKEDLFDENMQVSNSWPLSNLNYDVHYEVRAQYVVCKESKSETDPNRIYAPYSDTINFIVNAPVSDEKACGDNLPDLQPCDPNAIPIITAGSEINADGVTVVVDSVSFPVPDDKSIISGTGHVGLPFFNRIGVRMSFDNVKINCANELVKGRIVSVYDEKYCALIDLDNNGKDPSGGPNKAPTKAKLKKLDPANLAKEPVGQFLYDDDKNVYVKTSDGETQPIGKLVSFNSKEYAFQNSAEESDHCILFYNTDPKIAFDDDEKKIYRNVYYYNQWYGGQNDFVAPWMANNPGKVNGVRAKEYKANNDETSFKSVRFFVPCETGESTESSEYVELNHGVSDDDYTVDIPGWENFDNSMEVFAAAQKEGEETYYNVGKMIAEVYKRRTHKLKIVSLLPGITLDAYKKAAEETLDAIYGSRLGITYQVETEDFSNNEVIKSLDLKGNGLDIAADKEHKWSNNTDMMKKILRAYKDEKEIDKHTAYLFVADHPSEPEYKDVEGDMPVGESAGFLFDSNMKNINIGRLIAHEIGHGVYNLSHTFDQFEKGKTGNLMDYCDGDFLAHHQWKVIDDSTRIVWKFMQDDEDGMVHIHTGNPAVDWALGTAADLAIQVGSDVVAQNALDLAKGDLPHLGKSFSEAIDHTFTVDNVINTAIDNAPLGKELKETIKGMVDFYAVCDECILRSDDPVECLCEKLTSTAINKLLVEKIKDVIKKSNNRGENPQQTQDVITLVFGLFGEDVQKTVSEIVKKANTSFDESIASTIVDSIAENLCQKASELLINILEGDGPAPQIDGDDLFVHKLEYRNIDTDPEYDYIEFVITQKSSNKFYLEDKLKSALLYSTSLSKCPANLPIDAEVNMIPIDKMEENHIYFVSHDQFDDRSNSSDIAGRDVTRVVGDENFSNEQKEVKWSRENKYIVKVKHTVNGECCDYLLLVRTEQGLIARPIHKCDDNSTSEAPTALYDICYEEDKKDGYEQNPFIGAPNRIQNEITYNVPKCSGWTKVDGKFKYASPYVCNGPERADKLYEIEGDKAVIQPSVAAKYVNKVFKFWGDKNNTNKLVEKVLVYENNQYKMVDLDEAIVNLQSQFENSPMELYAKILFLAFSGRDNSSSCSTMLAIKNAYESVSKEYEDGIATTEKNNFTQTNNTIAFDNITFKLDDLKRHELRDICDKLKFQSTTQDLKSLLQNCETPQIPLFEFIKQLENTKIEFSISKTYYDNAVKGREEFLNHIDVINRARSRLSETFTEENLLNSDQDLYYDYVAAKEFEKFALKLPEFSFLCSRNNNGTYSVGNAPYLKVYNYYNKNGIAFSEAIDGSAYEYQATHGTLGLSSNFVQYITLLYCYDKLTNLHSVFLNRILRYVFRLRGFDFENHNGAYNVERQFSIDRNDCIPAWYKQQCDDK